MNPAFSVLFLTTLIGAGQGLLIALVTGQWYFVIGAGDLQESGRYYALGSGLALVLLGLGLFASFFHLANPQRAWRAATKWRTSWLAREVVVLPAVMGLTFLYGVAHWFDLNWVLYTFSNHKSLTLTMAIGFVAAGAAGLLFLCTGMIYACVKFIREWASIWTVVNYTLMGVASGYTIAAAYASVSGSPLAGLMNGLAIIATIAALGGRAYHLWRNARLKCKSTLKSAIGVHHGQIRQLTQGFLGQSFNTVEFRAPGGAELIRALTAVFLTLAFALPVALVAIGWQAGESPLIVAAVAMQYLGLLAERWVFFAQGSHVQNLYYQRMA